MNTIEQKEGENRMIDLFGVIE